MDEKGIVRRDDRTWPSKYSAEPTREATQSRLVDDLLVKAFGGSAESLVLHVLSTKKADSEELRAIYDLLATMEKDR
jgi:predicted transcriptional regulator